jgi:hypothetical protein
MKIEMYFDSLTGCSRTGKSKGEVFFKISSWLDCQTDLKHVEMIQNDQALAHQTRPSLTSSFGRALTKHFLAGTPVRGSPFKIIHQRMRPPSHAMDSFGPEQMEIPESPSNFT